MSEFAEGAPETAGAAPKGGAAPKSGTGPGADPVRPTVTPARTQPSLTLQVRQRRADEAFFLRLRDAIAQNHRALERLGT